jgi:hypothetical protein
MRRQSRLATGLPFRTRPTVLLRMPKKCSGGPCASFDNVHGSNSDPDAPIRLELEGRVRTCEDGHWTLFWTREPRQQVAEASKDASDVGRGQERDRDPCASKVRMSSVRCTADETLAEHRHDGLLYVRDGLLYVRDGLLYVREGLLYVR